MHNTVYAVMLNAIILSNMIMQNINLKCSWKLVNSQLGQSHSIKIKNSKNEQKLKQKTVSRKIPKALRKCSKSVWWMG